MTIQTAKLSKPILSPLNVRGCKRRYYGRPGQHGTSQRHNHYHRAAPAFWQWIDHEHSALVIAHLAFAQ